VGNESEFKKVVHLKRGNMVSGNEYLFADHVLSEVDLLELLNIEKPALDELRRKKGLPYIRLSRTSRVYLSEDVVKWLREQRLTY